MVFRKKTDLIPISINKLIIRNNKFKWTDNLRKGWLRIIKVWIWNLSCWSIISFKNILLLRWISV